MRQDAHTAAAALPVARFGHGRAVVANGDARVKDAQIFRNRSDDFFVFGESGLELFAWPDAEKDRYAGEHRGGWATFMDRLARLLAERRRG